MRAPGWAGRWTGRGRHTVPPLFDPWPRHGALVLVSAGILSVLLVAVVLGWQPPFRNGSGLAAPVPADTTDAAVPPRPADPSLPPMPPMPPTGPPSAPPTGPPVAGPPLTAPPTSGAPVTSAPGSPPGAPLPAPPVRFLAVSGQSCPQTAASGYYYQGWYHEWYTRSTGGWTGDSCGGQVVSVPMSGDLNADDLTNVVVWWFRVPSGATCALTVYVPGTGNVLDADGAPATYFVYGTTDASGSRIGQFTVDQVHNQGRWVGVGTFAQRTGQLSVRMVTRGIDWGSGRTGAHLGVSALRVTC